ncbi:MAG: flagellar hook-basal body complex protein FliE [Spirochaetia bacterium]|nr:flagellar hook-basal body complex protein FliE [Spirochaetia bacterium]
MGISSQILPLEMAKGDIIPLSVSQKNHFNEIRPKEVSESPAENFASLLFKTLQKVNDQQVDSEKLSQQLVSDPGSVSLHSVLIAAEKARMSLTYTKTLADLAVKTYRELINLR